MEPYNCNKTDLDKRYSHRWKCETHCICARSGNTAAPTGTKATLGRMNVPLTLSLRGLAGAKRTSCQTDSCETDKPASLAQPRCQQALPRSYSGQYYDGLATVSKGHVSLSFFSWCLEGRKKTPASTAWITVQATSPSKCDMCGKRNLAVGNGNCFLPSLLR